MKIDKKLKTLIILCAVLVVLGAALAIISGIDTTKAKVKDEQQTLFEISFEDLTKIAWCNGEDDALSFYKEDGVWHLEGDADFPVDTDALEDVAEVFASFKTNFTITEAENLSQYGLNKQDAYISYATADAEGTVYIGTYSTVDSLRYVQYGDDVFLARKDPMDYIEECELYTMLLAESVPDFVSGLVSLNRQGTEEKFDMVTLEAGKYSYSEDYTYFTTGEKTDYLPLETSSVEAYGEYICGLDYKNFASYSGSDEDLAKYGLDDPEFTITIDYKETVDEEEVENNLVLAYGTNGEDYVVRIGDSKVICLLDQESYEFIRDVDINEYRPNQVLDMDWETVTSLEITLDGSHYTFNLADEDSDEDDAPDYSKVRKALNALDVELYTEEADLGKLEISVQINLENEDYSSINLSIYRFDGDSCVVRWGGNTYCMVEREAAMDFVESVYAIVLNY